MENGKETEKEKIVEETKEEIKSNEKKTRKKKKSRAKIIIFSIICLVIFVGVIIAFLLLSNHDTDCHKIAKKLSKDLNEPTLIDIEKTSGEYAPIESTKVYTKETGYRQGTDRYAILIEKYSSNNEAQMVDKYTKETYKLFHDKLDGTLFELADDYKTYFEAEDDLMIVNGVYFIRINSYLKDKYDFIENEVNNIIKDYDTSDISKVNGEEVEKYYMQVYLDNTEQINNSYTELLSDFKGIIDETITSLETCKGDECDALLNEVLELKKYKDTEESIQLVQKKYNEVIGRKKELVNTINKNISKVENSLSQAEYDKIKKQIDEIDETFYNDYKKNWEKRLNAIDKKVFKKSCSSLNYKNVLRDPDAYKGKRAYWFGVVQQKVGDTQYRIGVNCEKYHYIDGYNCANTIYVFYYGNAKLIEDDVVKVYGTMDGTVTYNTVIGATVTVPSVNAEYIDLQ